MRILKTLCFASLLIYSSTALACSCIPQVRNFQVAVTSAFNSAEVVFLGRVENIEVGEGAFKTVQKTDFIVLEMMKGDERPRISTKISIQCCICGFSFRRNETYIVYAYKGADGFYKTSICTRTKTAAENAEEVGLLRKLKKDGDQVKANERAE